MNEIWKSVPGFEGQYEVSNMGNVRSWLDRARKRRDIPVQLKPQRSTDGYVRLSLGHKNSVFIHKLVSAVFIGLCPKGMEVNHIDLNKTNNRVDNLEYLTHVDNVKHVTAKGGVHRKLNNEQRKEIHALFHDGKMRQAEIARKFNVTQGAIHYVLKELLGE